MVPREQWFLQGRWYATKGEKLLLAGYIDGNMFYQIIKSNQELKLF